MASDVYLYDHTLTPESSSMLEILETDTSGVKLDFKMNGSLGGGSYGARLKAPSRPDSVNIWINDRTGHYAPASLCHLHGSATVQLHVALYPLPTGGTGTGAGGGATSYQTAYGVGRRWPETFDEPESREPQTPLEIFAYIDGQLQEGIWETDEAEGVRRLVEAVMNALSLTKKGNELQSLLEAWNSQLQELGIKISIVARNTRGGGHTQGGGRLFAGA